MCIRDRPRPADLPAGDRAWRLHRRAGGRGCGRPAPGPAGPRPAAAGQRTRRGDPDGLGGARQGRARAAGAPGSAVGVLRRRGLGRCHEPVRWDGRGLLLVAGRGGSGRSTAATTVAQAALDAGWHVHLVTCSGPLQLGTRDRPRRTAGLGTVLTAADPRGVARLLTILLANRDRHRCLLVLDDVAAVQRALDRFPRGCGTDLLDRLLRAV